VQRYIRLKYVRLFGASIFVHWSVLVVAGILFVFALSSPVRALITMASYLGVIVVHEMGHALMATKLGCEVIAIRVGVVHGRCEHEETSSEWDEVLIAWGGVIAQTIVAVGVLTVAALVGDRGNGYFGPVVVFLGYFNLAIAAFNLAPTPPLDGHKAWRIVPLLLHRIRAHGHRWR
jgi:Zn-dependent protease